MRRRGASGAAALIILLARVVAEDYYGGDVIQGGHFMDDEMPLMDDECPDDSFDVRNRRRLHRGARGGARARRYGACLYNCAVHSGKKYDCCVLI